MRVSCGMLGWLLLVLPAGAAGQSFVLPDQTSGVYYTLTVAAGEGIELESGVRIQGSVHSNRNVDLQAGSVVDVDVSAAGTISGAGSVGGTRLAGAPSVALPALFDEAAARARADRIVEKDATFDTLQTIDGVLFVDGNVRFRAGVAGSGTVIASGDILLDNVTNGNPVSAPSTTLSLIAFRDALVGKGRPLRCALRAGRHVVFDKEVRFQGVVVAGGKVRIHRDSLLTFVNVDPAPPVVTPLAPAVDGLVGEASPEIRASFSDGFSGIDLDTVRLYVDAEDRGAEARIDAAGLSLRRSLSDGTHNVEISVQDRSGRFGQAFWFFRVDTAPPALSIQAPSPGQISNQPLVRVAGEATDANGVDSVEVNGNPAALDGNIFTADVALAEGTNAITVRAVDGAGNASEAILEVSYYTLPAVAITSPEDLVFLAATTVDVRGTVSDPAAAVTVNGIPAPVSGGTFLAREVPLTEGGNILAAVAIDARGHVGTDSIQVVRDLTAPRVVVSYPRDGARVFEPSIAVIGMVNDIVAGTVNASEVTVTVDGRPAVVANRSFSVDGLTLAPGLNALTVLAVDESGNQGRTTVTVRYDPVPARRIRIVSGNHQSAVIGTTAPQPLRVALVEANGAPVAGATVLFKVVDNNGSLDGDRRQVATVTAADGQAQVRFKLGTRAGIDNQVVEAVALGFAGPAVFTATALAGEPAHILVDAGNQQTGTAGQPLPRPLVATVTDAAFNRLAGVPVTFLVTDGQGGFEGAEREMTVETDGDGRALSVLVLDPAEGNANNVVEASIAGLENSPRASFFASGLAAGPPALTSVSGVVLDNASQPVKGVTLRVLDTDLTAVTDLQGQFRIPGVTPGLIKLIVDGSTAERPGSWPDLEFQVTTVAGRDNTVGMPIYLLPLDLPNGVYVDETRGGTLTLPEVPGFSLEIAPGSVTFPGGSRSGLVSATVVHSDKVPMVPNFGQQPRFIVTIQPAGARFEPPGRLRLPNLEGLAPGQVTEMYSFDHDLGHFVSIGPATVSEDGLTIVSNPGVGILKAGWHCGGNPATAGTPHACPECTVCNGSQCVEACTLNRSASADETTGIENIFATAGQCLCGKDANKICKGKKCVCPVPVNFQQTVALDIGNGELFFQYEWDSNTGQEADLKDCVVYEHLEYDSQIPIFVYPRPWIGFSKNPTDFGHDTAVKGFAIDEHSSPELAKPYVDANYTVSQYYRYTCPCANNGNPVDLDGPIPIHRRIFQLPDGRWIYRLTKSGMDAETTLP